MGAQGLDFQVVDVRFTQGLDTRTQRKLVVPGKWDDLMNLTLSEDNTPQTRDGHSVLVASANGNGLATHNDELLTVSGPGVSSVSLAAGTANPVGDGAGNFGVLGYVGISKAEVRRTTGMQDTPDCASGGGYTCYVWREKSAVNATLGIAMTLIDESTGTQLFSGAALRNTTSVFGARVVFAAGAFFIFYIDGTSLYCVVIAAAAPTALGAETALITSANLANINYDACAFGSTPGSVMVVYGWADGVTSTRTIEVTTTGTTPSINAGPTNLTAELALPVINITALCCAAYASATEAGAFITSTGITPLAGLTGVVIDSTWAIFTAATQLSAVVGATTANCHLTAVQDGFRLRVFRDFESEWNTNALNNITAQVVNNGLATFAGPTSIVPSSTFGAGVTARGPQGPFIHGKAYVTGGRIFLPVFVGGVYAAFALVTSNPRTQNTQNSFFLFDTGAVGSGPAVGTVVAKALYGSYGLASINANPPTVGTPCSSPEVTTGSFATVSGELTLLVLNSSGLNISPTGLVRLTMTPNFSAPAIREQLGESTYFAGGSLSNYDGTNLVEHGFPLYPDGVGIIVNAVGGAMTAGVHQVCFIFEWVDGAGQRHQSAPSLPITVTTVANGSLTCQIPSLLLTRRADIQVVPFMTQAGGTIFNRVLLNNGAYVPVFNTNAANIATFTIDDADATIAGNALLYTQPLQAGTTLENIAPGPSHVLTVAQNRLWFDVADQPGVFGYSQEYVNNIGLRFSPVLSSSVPSDGGDIVAIAALDEKVVIFCSRRIYVVYGTGPTPSGGFNNYSKPQDIQADVGCSDARSVLTSYPGGIIFKSQKGWHVLGRGLDVKYIGDGVARWDGQSVTAAVILEDRQECRFVTNGSLGPVTLVYSYLVDQWSYFTQPIDEGTNYIPVDAMWWPAAGNGAGRYVTISAANGLNQDTPGLYTDQPGAQSPVGIRTRARTGWLHLERMERFQRVRWLYLTATAAAAPTSTLTIGVDFDDVYGSFSPGSYSFNVALATAFPGTSWLSAAIDLRHKLQRQKCKSVAFTFTETAAAGQNRLSGFQALALELGMKRGTNKLPAAQSVG